MTKTFTGFIFFSLLVLTLSSCSRLLRPNAGGPRKHKGTTGNDNPNTTGKNPIYNTGTFTGTLIKNIAYTTAANYKGTEQQLAFDVYKPADAEGKKFPAIILIHGGSFIGGDKANLSSTCSKLANNGYVVISINYRLGWGFVSRSTTTCNDSSFLKQAIYRSAQDAHTALRYIAAHADNYNVDKNWIFLGGQSAGAITALMTAYLQEKNSDTFFPGLAQKLGLLDKDKNNSSADFTLKGVISMWGAFANPELITDQTALPTIFFQGELDKAVPFYSRPFVPCNAASMVYGTYPLYNRLKTLGETAIAHVDPKGGHGVFEEDFRINNILCFLNDVRQGIKKQIYLTGVQNSCDK
ncbi:MAG: alpha/beta hydrolase [Parafilimonas sp.]